MALSIFEKKTSKPSEEDLSKVLGDLFFGWKQIKELVLENAPDIFEEWNYSGKNYGWSFRLKNTKKVIIYLTPCAGSFYAGFVFGPAATEEIMRSSISEEIKMLVDSANVYSEGRGIRLAVSDENMLEDIKKLVMIKLGIKFPHK